MVETTEFVQGDYTFYIRPMDPFKALDLLGDLQKTFLPAMGAAFGKSDLGEEQTEDVTLSKLMHRKIDLEAAATKLSSAVSGSILIDLLTRILQGDSIAYCPDGDKGNLKKLDKPALSAIYVGRPKSMLELAWKVLRVNYSDFFTI